MIKELGRGGTADDYLALNSRCQGNRRHRPVYAVR
jgi:hypothetical protein